MKLIYCTNQKTLSLFKNAWLNTKDLDVGIDTETTGLSCHSSKLRLIQFAIEDTVYILDFFKIENLAAQLDSILNLRDDIRLSGQNLKFDIQFLWANNINIEHLTLFDTMLTAQLLAKGLSLGFGLDDIVTRYLNVRISKDEQTSDWSAEDLSESQLRYAAIDANSVKKLCPVLHSLIKAEGMEAVFELEHRTLFATAAMEFYGIKCDLDKIAEMRPYFENKLKEAETSFIKTIDDRYMEVSFNGDVVHPGLEVSSSSQVLKALQSLGIKDPLNPKVLVQSTGTGHLKLIKNISEYPSLEALFDYRKASKLLTSYIYSLPGLINPVTKRLHTNYQQMVSTGRLSSSNPNLQQMPRPSKDNPVNIREAFVPEEGFTFVQADYCMAMGTRVATTKGLVPIELATPGDVVFQDDNTTQKVLSVIDRGYLNVFELKTRMGYSITCTENHRIRVIDSNNNYVWKTIKDITEEDQIAIVAGRGLGSLQDKYRLPEINYNHTSQQQNSSQAAFPKYADEEFCQFVGYITGGGSFYRNHLKWTVWDRDRDVFDWIQNYVENTFGKVNNVRECKGTIEGTIYNAPLLRIFRFLGIAEKTVPDFIFQSPTSAVRAYLRGLFESVGFCTDRVFLTATDLSFIQDVQQLLLAVGIPSVIVKSLIVKSRKNPFKEDTYFLNIPPAYINAFQHIKFISARKNNKLTALGVTSKYSSNYGGLEIDRELLKQLDLNAEERFILRNSIDSDKKISLRTAASLLNVNRQLADQLNLTKVILHNHIYDRVAVIESKGQSQCFDLEVENTHAYIANGFVSHNSQIELRVMAEVVYTTTGDRAMLDEFLENKDPYTNTAALMMGYDYDSMFENGVLKPEYKPLRQSAKAIRLGLNYVMQAEKLKNYSKQVYGVVMTDEEAVIYRERYFELYKGLAEYHEACDTPALHELPIAYTLEPFKRPRLWEKYPGPSGISNHPIQGSSADITKLAMALIYEYLFDLGYSPTQSSDIRPVLTNHDELVLESKEELKELAGSLLQKSMFKAAKTVLKVCPVEAEINFLKSLAEK